ncbi:MAG TPA: META domain-containing protein [Longimicrobium sp.]|nr:META domain-containing protein [Longimicrobium sp.]
MRCAEMVALALVGACRMTPAPEPSAGAAGVPLENTAWTLAEVRGQPARAIGSGAGPTLRLDAAQTRASGDTGCNQYGGPYELSGTSLRLGPLVSTRRACVDEALNRQETAFLAALEEARSWRVDEGTLVLSGPSGPVARLVARR